jgi:hypothetical protein
MMRQYRRKQTMVSKTPAEIDTMKAEIAAGVLPPNAIERYLEEEAKAVFGHDYKRDSEGRPQEQGLGSPQQPTRNSLEAYKRWGREDPSYHENVARMERELAEYERKQASKRGAARRM